LTWRAGRSAGPASRISSRLAHRLRAYWGASVSIGPEGGSWPQGQHPPKATPIAAPTRTAFNRLRQHPAPLRLTRPRTERRHDSSRRARRRHGTADSIGQQARFCRPNRRQSPVIDRYRTRPAALTTRNGNPSFAGTSPARGRRSFRASHERGPWFETSAPITEDPANVAVPRTSRSCFGGDLLVATATQSPRSSVITRTASGSAVSPKSAMRNAVVV
jgi:hypothetical protein